MTEYIDVVNKDGTPTGDTKTRVEIHSGSYWHNVVHVYIFRKKGVGLEFLVHLRSKDKDSNPDKWDARSGGHVKAGETIEDTVITELKEEIGMSVEYKDMIHGFVKSYDWPNNYERISVYYYPFDGDISSLKFNDGEVQEAKWMAMEDILIELQDSTKWSGGVKGFQEAVEDLKKKIR